MLGRVRRKPVRATLSGCTSHTSALAQNVIIQHHRQHPEASLKYRHQCRENEYALWRREAVEKRLGPGPDTRANSASKGTRLKVAMLEVDTAIAARDTSFVGSC